VAETQNNMPTTPQFTADDRRFMRRALTLARRAWGRTSPNPLVGAVVVQNNEIVGEGYHHQAGMPHAEVEALNNTGAEAKGATLYVTLEPCCTTGRTPPCTEAIQRAGIKRVIIGTLDPNPDHAGQAIKILKNAGIETAVGLCETACRELNEAFFHWITRKRPFITLKMAMTLDGKIATAEGDSKWVTGEKSRTYVQRLRQWADAIMVGGETVLQDNPELTVRTPKSWKCQPRRIVWTTRQDFPRSLKVWNSPENPPQFAHPDSPQTWQAFLNKLGEENVTALLIEGGGELAAACLASGFVDKVMFFIAPKILGGRNSRTVVGGSDPAKLSEALNLKTVATRRIGEDILVSGWFHY
jgi:diaminohydroxyphosphoribosylaminopyrimidine deaminase/5-amino-6-(5-phosphoribosylamino)uracil reductase